MEKKKTGRPRVLDDKKKDEIIRIIKIGGSRAKAALFVGCDKSTIIQESKRDEQFYTRLKAAEGEAYAGYLTVVAKAAQGGDVKAAQWFLARKYPDEFGQMTKHALTNSKGRDLTPEERHRLMESIIAERKAMESS